MVGDSFRAVTFPKVTVIVEVPLTAPEAEVRAQFMERARLKFQDRRIPVETTVLPEIVISAAVLQALVDFGNRNNNRLRFFLDALDALGAERELSQQERAVMETYTPIFTHLAQLAGFSSYAELEEWMAGILEECA